MSAQSWETCPKCNGNGHLMIRVTELTALGSVVGKVCDVCHGEKIINTITGLPPNGMINLTPQDEGSNELYSSSNPIIN